MILIFKDNELFKQIAYKNKTIAKKHYKFFLKHGYIDAETGLKVNGLIFELI